MDDKFKLPRDKDGNFVDESYLMRKYRLPRSTKVRRNLVIRYWYRKGISVKEIMEQSICSDLKTPQAVYNIINSKAYDFMEEEYGLN